MCEKYISTSAYSKMVMTDYADYTDFQDCIKNNFTSDYVDHAVTKGY